MNQRARARSVYYSICIYIDTQRCSARVLCTRAHALTHTRAQCAQCNSAVRARARHAGDRALATSVKTQLHGSVVAERKLAVLGYLCECNSKRTGDSIMDGQDGAAAVSLE